VSEGRARPANRARGRGGVTAALLAAGRWAAPRKWRLVGAMLVLLVYGALWVGYAAGATMLLSPLVVAPAIVVLVAAGNLLQGWLGIGHRAPQFAQRADAGDEQGDGPAPTAAP
jgi:hypothetical protein